MQFKVSRLLFCLMISSCSSMKNINKSYLNHKAMVVGSRMTPSIDSNINRLTSESIGNLGGCVTCAK